MNKDGDKAVRQKLYDVLRHHDAPWECPSVVGILGDCIRTVDACL